MIRNGYVSNSSSSSFCVYARQLDPDEDMNPDRQYMGFYHGDEDCYGEGGQILLEFNNSGFIEWANSSGKIDYIRDRYSLAEIHHAPDTLDLEVLKDLKKIIMESGGKSWSLESGECDMNSIETAEDFEEFWAERDDDYVRTT